MYTCKYNQTCPNVLIANSVTTNDTNLLFNVPNTISPVNGGKYVFKCPVSLLPSDASTTIYQVNISLNGTVIPLQCVIGNNVYSDQIRCFNTDSCCNIVLRLIYGTAPAHFKIINQSLCCSNAYPVIVAQTTTSNSTSKVATKKTTQVTNE